MKNRYQINDKFWGKKLNFNRCDDRYVYAYNIISWFPHSYSFRQIEYVSKHSLRGVFMVSWKSGRSISSTRVYSGGR